MTHTPPRARQVVRRGVGVVAITLLVVNSVLFLVLSSHLDRSVEDLLDARVAAVRAEAAAATRDGDGPDELAGRLQGRGLPATVRAPDGSTSTAEPTSPAVASGLPASLGPQERRTRVVELSGGVEVEVSASTVGVRNARGQLLLVQAATSLGALALAALLLRRTSHAVTRPVTQIATVAARTAKGNVGERLRPDDATTELGRMAAAYDEMVGALESSLAQAREAHAAQALLAAVVEGSTDAIWVQTLDGTIMTWNTAGERTLGWTSEQIVGRRVSTVVPEGELEELSSLVAEVVAVGEVRSYEGERLTHGGKTACPCPYVCRRSATTTARSSPSPWALATSPSSAG